MTILSREQYERLVWEQRTADESHVGSLLNCTNVAGAGGQPLGSVSADPALVLVADHLGHRLWYDGPAGGCGCGFKVSFGWEVPEAEDRVDDETLAHLLGVGASAVVEHDHYPPAVVAALVTLVEHGATAPLRELITALDATLD